MYGALATVFSTVFMEVWFQETMFGVIVLVISFGSGGPPDSPVHKIRIKLTKITVNWAGLVNY